MYSHTQPGWMTFAAMAGAILAIGAAGIQLNPQPGAQEVLALAMVVLALMLPVFGWLTVTVDEEAVTARFGIGLFRKKIRIRDILGARPVRNKWWYGWGLRMGSWGWMYNVSSLDAVELELRDGARP